ncbi:MAG: NUDIX domain-containing protein [Myxococcales bacterium]|nr:MAG: NUDIX domain-containing protein [Myxococcales bacterium]
MPRVKSCGLLLFRDGPPKSFLLMCLPGRYDLPKGHLEGRETELQCAMRELNEETGIAAEDVELDPGFRYTETYFPRYRRFGGRRVEKTLVIFLGRLSRGDVTIKLTEHDDCEWVAWPPPPTLQRLTVDPLLYQVAVHWARQAIPGARPSGLVVPSATLATPGAPVVTPVVAPPPPTASSSRPIVEASGPPSSLVLPASAKVSGRGGE